MLHLACSSQIDWLSDLCSLLYGHLGMPEQGQPQDNGCTLREFCSGFPCSPFVLIAGLLSVISSEVHPYKVSEDLAAECLSQLFTTYPSAQGLLAW